MLGKKNKQKAGMILALISLVIVLGYGLITRLAPEKTSTDALPSSTAASQSSYAYEFSYTVDGEATLAMVGGAKAANPAPLSIDLEADGRMLLTRVSPANQADVTLRGRLVFESFRNQDGTQNAGSEGLRKDLETSFFELTLPADGTRSLAFSGQLPASAQNFLRDLTQAFQIPKLGASDLELSDSDRNGSFLVRYTALPAQGAQRLKRVKVRYLPRDQGPEVHIVASDFSLQVQDAQRLPFAYEGHEELRFRRSDQDLGWSKVQMSFKKASKISNADQGKIEALRSSQARVIATAEAERLEEERVEDQMASNRLGSATLNELIAMNQARADGQSTDLADLARKFAAFARLYPERSQELIELLDGKDPKDFLFQSILMALAEADYLPAHEALVDLAHRRKDDGRSLITIYGTYSLVTKPQTVLYDEARRAHQNHADAQVREASGLAMAAVAGEIGGEIADRLAHELTDSYQSSKTLDEKTYVLRQLGNLGHDQLYAFLEAIASGTEPRLRDHAIRGMRFVEDARVDAYLSALLQNSLDERAISAALASLQLRRAKAETIEAYSVLMQRQGPGINQKLEALDRIVSASPNKDLTRRFLLQMQNSKLPEKLQTAVAEYLKKV